MSRRRWSLRLGVVAAVCAIGLAAAAADMRVALVLGNGAYRNAVALPNPVNDARAIAQALREIGFAVTEGADLDRTGMERQIRAFLREAESAQVTLVFYAGHGMQVDGKNYLVPVDAKLEAARDLAFETIDLDKILEVLNEPGRTSIVMLDACRDNPLARSFARSLGASRSAAVPAGLAPYATIGTGMLIAFATAPGQVALDGAGANSPFTQALLRHLRTPGLEVRQMLTRVRSEVASATHNRQIPWDNSSLLGDVYLAGVPSTAPDRPAAPVAVTPPAAPADEAAWQEIKDTGVPAVFEAFLRNFPGSPRTAEARARLDELKHQQSATVVVPPPAAPVPPVADMRRPIDALYVAWRRLDLRDYLDQWAAEGVKIDLKSGRRSALPQLAQDRARLFGQLAGVDADYQVTFRGIDGGVAAFDVAYAMSFRWRSGRTVVERACESYKVRQDAGRWLIIENQDYKPC